MSDIGKLPIGVFDSGVGGLTVVRAFDGAVCRSKASFISVIRPVCPTESSRWQLVEHFTGQITDYLLDQGVKMLIIACNTMAAVAAQVVKEKAVVFRCST